jgi:tetratricopeptide (TPR) repeat protein
MHQEELFLKANKRYEQRRYEDARCLYEMVEPKGSAVWHNLGNCFYYEQRYIEALCAWRKAFRGSTWRDKMILQEQIKNLCYEQGWSDKQHRYQLSSAHCLVHTFPWFFWQILFLCFWIGLLSMYGWSPRRNGFRLFLLGLVLLLSSSAFYWCYQAQRPRLFVTTKGLLYVGPNAEFHHRGQLEEGDEVILLEERPGWVKVATPTAQGWLVDKNCTIL